LGKLLGTAAGAVGANDTQVARDLAPAIGGGVALAAYLGNVGGIAAASGLSATAGAFAVIAVPLFEITYAIVIVVDHIVRTVEAEQWKDMCREIRRLREAGDYEGAMVVFWKVAKPAAEHNALVIDATGKPVDLGGLHVEFKGISELSQVWPQPGDDWYNTADPLGRPYAGFPSWPAPATRAEVARWPKLGSFDVPLSYPNGVSTTVNSAELLTAAYADAASARDHGLQIGAPGRNAAGAVVTTGPRDIRDYPPYRATLANADAWAVKLAAAAPASLAPDALVRDIRIPVEVARDDAAAAAVRAAKKSADAKRVAVANDELPVVGTTKKPATTSTVRATATTRVSSGTAPIALVQASSGDTTAQARTGSANRKEAGADGARTGGTGPGNKSGSGGRNG
jgi:hypothetical protein